MKKSADTFVRRLFRRCKGAAILVAVFSGLFAADLAPVFASGADPSRFIASIYARGHVDAVWTQWLSDAKRGAWFSRDVAALWRQCDASAHKAKDELGPLDFVIATNSQLDWSSFKGFTVSVVSQGDGHAVVNARLQTRPNTVPPKVDSDNVIHYDLVEEGSAWKIDDVSSTVDGKPWSLRQLLKDYLKN
jgi:hypothetical protein